MRMRNRFCLAKWFLLATVVALAGCASDTSDSADQAGVQEDDKDPVSWDAIVAGEEVRARKTRVASAVMQMAIVDRTTDEKGHTSLEQERCTATLIGERVVLTAGHCVDHVLHRKLYRMQIDPKTARAKSAGYPVIVVGHEIDRSSPSAIALAVPPEFREVDGAPQPDLALVLLDRPVHLPSQALRPHLDLKGLVKTGGRVTAMGFGLTRFDPLAPLKAGKPQGLYQKIFRVVDSRKVNWRAKRKASDTFFMGVDRGQPRGSICQGDSGGPVFAGNSEPRSGAVTIVGVISRSEADCGGFSAAVSVSKHADWIQRQAAKWQAKLF